jgi:cysteine-rich repeat protein
VCGDGHVFTGVEQCDDGNTTQGDTCENDCTLPKCGNGIKDTGEACDDGNKLNGDGCENDCTTGTCGNGFIDPGEECDDGAANGCGACATGCGQITIGNATGLIFAPSGSELAAAATGMMTVSFVVSDDYNGATAVDPVTFVFATPTAGQVQVAFTMADPMATVAMNIATAINTNKWEISAVAVNNVVVLTNTRTSSRGNGAITVTAGGTSLSSSGTMAGGKGGDCTVATVCTTDADCMSGRCTAGKCATCTTNAQCDTKLCDGTLGVCESCRTAADCHSGSCNAGFCSGT